MHVELTNCVSQTQEPQPRSLLQACPLPFVIVRRILPSRGGQIPGTSYGSTSWTRSTAISVLVPSGPTIWHLLDASHIARRVTHKQINQSHLK
jgi:hypothetical protein